MHARVTTVFWAAALLCGTLCLEAIGAEKELTYVSFFEHFESAPVRGVAGTVQFRFPYSGRGPVPFSVVAKNIVTVCEKYGIKIEFAFKPDSLQQLAEDFPEVIEKLKALRMPITRYWGVSHHLPAPVARMREIPGIDEMGLAEYLRAEWLFETHNLIPNWRDNNGYIFPSNPEAGGPFTMELLPRYRWQATPENLYGGTLAIQKILGVTPMPLFIPRLEGQQSDAMITGAFGETAVQKALGIGSFPVSFHRGGKPANYIQVGVPRQGILSGSEEFERIVKQYLDRPDQFKIVWPDPEENQWKPQHSALQFYGKTYGAKSLEEALNMQPPVEKIVKMFPDRLPKAPAGGPKLRTPPEDWTKRLWTEADLRNHPGYLEPVILWETRELPAHLRSPRRDVSQQELLTAASYLLANRQGGAPHDGDFAAPPDYVVAGSKHWSLADTFQALALALDVFAKQQSLPTRVTIEHILGPIDYPMVDLREEPKYDPFKHRDGWIPRELPEEFFPDRELLRSQGIPAQADMPGSASVNEAYFLHAVYQTARRLKEEGHVPAVIPIRVLLPQDRAGPPGTTEIKCNAAEFLYGMADMYRTIGTEGLPRPVTLHSMKIIQDQLCRYVAPSTPAGITNSVYRAGAFIWRKKVGKWLLNEAWAYAPH